MYNIYFDSGTTNTRGYLIKGDQLIDSLKITVGTKDSAIAGSNHILLSAMKKCYEKLLLKNKLNDHDIDGVWASGMVTNTFGLIEVDHVNVPINAYKLLEKVYIHREEKFFKRNLMLIPGGKTVQRQETVTVENIDKINNVRGEEIEAIGLVATGIMDKDTNFVMISPGSHTHLCYVKNGALVDIVSTFTGELNHAIKKETILGGELSDGDIEMDEEYIKRGYQYLKQYGVSRALYIIHASRVFNICSDENRSQILTGIISGSVIDLLRKKISNEWNSVNEIIIIGGKSHLESYRILCESIMPKIPVQILDGYMGKSFALCGFLALLRLKKEKEL